MNSPYRVHPALPSEGARAGKFPSKVHASNHLQSSLVAIAIIFVATGLVALAAVPRDRYVDLPKMNLPAADAKIFAPESAMILKLAARPGDDVVAGTVLGQLFVPEIGRLQRSAQQRLDIAKKRLFRLRADQRDRGEVLVAEQQKLAALAELVGLKQRGNLLVLRAPIAGKISGKALSFHSGQWVERQDLLFQIVDGSRGTF